MDEARLIQISRSSRLTEREFAEFIGEQESRRWHLMLLAQLPPDVFPTQIANNVVTPADAPIPECLTCGACCSYFPLVDVGVNDATDREHYVEVTFQGERGEYVIDRFVKRDVEKMCCNALGGQVGVEVGCTIYEQRPYPCRRFEAGSDKCHAIRRMFGLEPSLSHQEMVLANTRLDEYQAESNLRVTIDEVQIREATDSENLEIIVLTSDGATRRLHEYDPHNEFWGQCEFSSLTIDEARELINSARKTSIL